MNNLVPISERLKPQSNALDIFRPDHEKLLASVGLDYERFKLMVLTCVWEVPALQDANVDSIVMAANSFARIGLEPNGATGQGWMIPFKGRAQPIIGYKGYNSLAAAHGWTITGGVVREGDDFDFNLGSEAYVRHKRDIRARGDRAMIGAYAVASHGTMRPIVSVLSAEEIEAVKARSPGGKKSDSPWNDPKVGYPAMAEKTAKRRLARSLPLATVQLAARMEEMHEEVGRYAYIDADGALRAETPPAAIEDKTGHAATKWEIVLADGSIRTYDTPETWSAMWHRIMDKARKASDLVGYRDLNHEELARDHVVVSKVRDALANRITQLPA